MIVQTTKLDNKVQIADHRIQASLFLYCYRLMLHAPSHSLHWLADAIRSIGISLESLPLPAGIPHTLLEDPNPEYNKDDYLAILQAVEDFTGDPAIAIALGNQIDIRNFGLYAYIPLNAASIRDLLTLTERYGAMVTQSMPARLRFHTGEDSSLYEYEAISSGTPGTRNDILLSMSLYMRLFRQYQDKTWQPIGVRFTFGQPKDIEAYYSQFGRNLLFSQPMNATEIDNKDLDKTINDTDQHLLNIVIAQAEAALAETQGSDRFCDRVRMLLIDRLETENAEVKKIAVALNVSLSTLRRRLNEEGTTFKEIRDQVIFDTAVEALTKTDAQISQIALKLSFSEVSSFNHAFKRLSNGISPRDYRKQFRVAT